MPSSKVVFVSSPPIRRVEAMETRRAIINFDFIGRILAHWLAAVCHGFVKPDRHEAPRVGGQRLYSLRLHSRTRLGQVKGVPLFHLASMLTFIERCESGTFTTGTLRKTRQ